jgi:hypothetical protein
MRALLEHEAPLVEYLLAKAGLEAATDRLRVEPMDDGGMGSLRFESDTPDPHFGKELAACEFEDEDGVLVSVTLNVDRGGKLFELDVWKTDFNALRRWPALGQIRDAKST